MSNPTGPQVHVAVSMVTWARRLVLVALPFVFAAAVAASLSDRAPFLLERGAFRLGVGPRLADGVAGIDPFALAHVAGWAAIAFAVGFATGRVSLVPLVAVALVGVGYGIEIAQQRTTSIRAYETGDIVANAVGVGLGSLAAAIVLALVATRTRA